MGKRVQLQAWRRQDAPTLLKWSQNPIFQQTAGLQPYRNLREAQLGIAQYQQRPYSFVIYLRADRQPIGIAELNERGLDKRSGLGQSKELGFLLDQAAWGHGYMTEALHLLISYAFGKLQQQEIWAGTFLDNERSQQLLKKLGFHYMYQVDYRALGLSDYVENYYLLRPTDW